MDNRHRDLKAPVPIGIAICNGISPDQDTFDEMTEARLTSPVRDVART